MLEIEPTDDNVAFETDDYWIKDYVIKDDENNIVATVCHTSLKPSKKTRGHIDTHNETYFFMDGNGVMMIDKDVVEVGVTGFHSAFVKKGMWHRVLNLNPYRNLNFLSVVPGIVNRPAYPAAARRGKH